MDSNPSQHPPTVEDSGASATRTPTGTDSPGFRKFLVAVLPGEANPKLWGIVAHLLYVGTRGIACFVVLQSTTAAADEVDGAPANPSELALDVELRARMVDRLGPAAQSIPVRILHGDPGQRICEYAVHAHCDLIILGRGARSPFRRLVQGSVSKFVLEHSRASVLRIGD